MPSAGQIVPYVLPSPGSDRQWCLSGILDHIGGQVRNATIKPIS